MNLRQHLLKNYNRSSFSICPTACWTNSLENSFRWDRIREIRNSVSDFFICPTACWTNSLVLRTYRE